MQTLQVLRFVLCLLPIAGIGVSLMGQQPGAGAGAPPLQRHGSPSLPRGAVVLDVVQQHVAGAPGEARTFNLLDNGKRVPSSSLHEVLGSESAGQTRQLLFVLDAVNSSLAELARSEEALETFLAAGQDVLPQPASILIVSDTAPQGKASADGTGTTALHARQLFVHRIHPSTNRTVLLHALRDYQPGLHRILESQAGPGQSERVRLSLEALSFVATAQIAVPGAKLAVWISPGWPYLASSPASSGEQIFDSIVYFSDLLAQARTVLYAVDPAGFSSGQFPSSSFSGPRDRSNAANIASPRVQNRPGDTFYENFLKSPKSAKDADANDLALQVLAIQSGGLVLQHDNDLKALLARCAAEANSLTTLRYTPATGDGVTRYHALSFSAPRGSGPVRTRAGFYLR